VSLGYAGWVDIRVGTGIWRREKYVLSDRIRKQDPSVFSFIAVPTALVRLSVKRSSVRVNQRKIFVLL
jgi:hypothetical protein